MTETQSYWIFLALKGIFGNVQKWLKLTQITSVTSDLNRSYISMPISPQYLWITRLLIHLRLVQKNEWNVVSTGIWDGRSDLIVTRQMGTRVYNHSEIPTQYLRLQMFNVLFIQLLSLGSYSLAQRGVSFNSVCAVSVVKVLSNRLKHEYYFSLLTTFYLFY